MTRLDAIAMERQFVDHLAPLWRALPDATRGRFLVDPSLVEHAAKRGVEAIPQARPPHVPAYPPPRFDGPRALVASYGDVKEGRRLGYGPFAFLEHGIGQTYGNTGMPNGSYSGGPDRADNTLILVPGPHPAGAWRRAYPGHRVEEVGSPRLDSLPRREPDGLTTVAISFHWPAPMSVSGYAGTAFGDYLPALPALAKAFHVIAHAHPKGDWQAKVRKHTDPLGIEFVPDFEDVCRRADLYVCDNSSTIYEFAATGRPVVLLNAKWWGRKGPELGLRFWEAANVGLNVDRHEDLVDTVRRALTPGTDQMEQMDLADHLLDKVYTHRFGAAERAAAAIVDWMAEEAVAA